jgi:hypothetical protein
MKKITRLFIFIFLILSLFSINIFIAQAQNCDVLNASPQELIKCASPTETRGITSQAWGFFQIFQFLTNAIGAMATMLSIAGLLVSLMRWAASKGDKNALKGAQELMRNSFFGLILSVSIWGVLYLVLSTIGASDIVGSGSRSSESSSTNSTSASNGNPTSGGSGGQSPSGTINPQPTAQ